MAAGSTGSKQFPKWQLALLIGTPVVIALGYYIYKNSSISSWDDGADDKKSKKKNIDMLKDKSISLDGTEQDKEMEEKKKIVELESEKLSPLREATMYKTEGNTCYRNGKYDEAITFYDKAIDKCPETHKHDLSIFYQNRAAAYEMLKRWSKVKADCSKSLECNPRYPKAYFRRAKAHEATNDMLDCLDDVTATCILEMFQSMSTITYADRILKQTGRDAAEKAIATREPILPSPCLIQKYFQSFVSDPIMKDISKLDDPKGYIRAKIAFDAGNYDDIIAACSEEINSSESESQYKPEALLLRGTLHLLSGNFTQAKSDLDAVINNGKAEADANLRSNALIKRGSLHFQLDNKELGFTDFDEAEKILPNNPDLHHQRAQIYVVLDQISDALEEFEKTVKLAPDHALAYVQKCYTEYRLAVTSEDHMRLTMVMNEFKNAIKKFPDCVDCYSLMAQVLSDQRQFEQADSFFEKAIKLSPKSASLYVHRGVLLLQWKGDVVASINLMNKAIEIDDRCELAYETLGTIEVQRANLDRAIELFGKAITLAKSKTEMSHLYALRNAAVAQINVTKKLGIDMSSISAMATS